MENISATTQTDQMIHDKRAELDQTSDSLQSHELAHQWFGDYVTCRTWADIWLNESFATYFQALWDEYKLGRDDFLYSDVKQNQDAYFAAWRMGNRRPIVTKNYENPDAVFDTYAYPRGGAVLHMLRKTLGEQNWWRAINYYLRKYANQPVETSQFRIAIEEATGQSMDWFFDEWLYRMGHPVFRVTEKYDPQTKELKLIVEQVQKLDPDSQYPQVALFQTPAEIEIGTASGTRIERVLIQPAKEQTFTFKADSKPLLVNFDYHGTLIKELEFQKTSEELLFQLTKDEDPLGRIWALSQLTPKLKDQATAASEREGMIDGVARALTQDKFWGMRVEAAAALAGVSGDVARQALMAGIKDPDARVRKRAVASLGSSKDSTLASTYEQLLHDQSYGVIGAAAYALGQTKDPKAYDALVKLLNEPSWRDTIKGSSLSGLQALGDPRALEVAMPYASAAYPTPVRNAAMRIIGTLGAKDPRAFPKVAELTKYAFDRNDFSLLIPATETLVTLGDPKGIPLLEEMTRQSEGIPQLRQVIGGALDRLRKVSATTTSNTGPPK
jgi:aminopeptidase N